MGGYNVYQKGDTYGGKELTSADITSLGRFSERKAGTGWDDVEVDGETVGVSDLGNNQVSGEVIQAFIIAGFTLGEDEEQGAVDADNDGITAEDDDNDNDNTKGSSAKSPDADGDGETSKTDPDDTKADVTSKMTDDGEGGLQIGGPDDKTTDN